MKKIFLLLSLLVTPRVFLEGGSITEPPQLSPKQDVLIGTINIYAEQETSYETYNVQVTSFYALNVPPPDLICITVDAYKDLIRKYCSISKIDGMETMPEIKKANNGPKQKI